MVILVSTRKVACFGRDWILYNEFKNYCKMKKKVKAKAENKYKVGDEFIYLNGRDICSKVEVIEVIPGGYLLSNQIKMNENLTRIDEGAKRYAHTILPLNEDTERQWKAYNAHHGALRMVRELESEIVNLNPFHMSKENQERVIRISEKLKKLTR